MKPPLLERYEQLGKEQRNQLKLVDFPNKTGLSKSSFYLYLSKEIDELSQVKANILQVFADAFGCSIDDLVKVPQS